MYYPLPVHFNYASLLIKRYPSAADRSSTPQKLGNSILRFAHACAKLHPRVHSWKSGGAHASLLTLWRASPALSMLTSCNIDMRSRLYKNKAAHRSPTRAPQLWRSPDACTALFCSSPACLWSLPASAMGARTETSCAPPQCPW